MRVLHLVVLICVLWVGVQSDSPEKVKSAENDKDSHSVLDHIYGGGDNEGQKSASFAHAFVAAFAVMIVSEIGDKTFFIAAILAMKHSRLAVFSGAMAALGFMTVLSAYFGQIATLIPRIYTMYISTGLFVFFGIKMLREGYAMSEDEGQEEFEEVSLEIKKKEEETELKRMEAQVVEAPGLVASILTPVFVQTMTMTFLAEWGDRSQIATIILGASEDVIGVCIGGVLGHSLCTALAVVGGRFVAQKISVRTVTLIGGVVFLIFAVSNIVFENMLQSDSPPMQG